MTDDTLEPQHGGGGADGQPDVPADSGTGAPAREQTLQQERDRYYDQLLRKTAEFDNYRKRTDRERREQAERVAADVLQEMLPILDDLERARRVDASDENVEAYRQGVELIHRQFLEFLKQRGVTAIDALGTDFDPHIHQAVTTEPAEGRRDGEVTEVLRRGYKLGDRLLRPAMVKVARS